VYMTRLAIALLLAAALVGCNRKTASADHNDPVSVRLQDAAGPKAVDCGRVKSVAAADTKPASDCALQAAKDKKPFYVAYDMPGLTVGVAGDSAGKLFAIQAQAPPPAEGQQPAQLKPTDVTITPCPSELRVAASGRVTCYPMSSFGSATGANPHGANGMMMPPATGENPHGGMMMPAPGTPNPHGNMNGMTQPMVIPNAHGSAQTGSSTKNSKAAPKDASKQ
jgi:hypothetical protein